MLINTFFIIFESTVKGMMFSVLNVKKLKSSVLKSLHDNLEPNISQMRYSEGFIFKV